MMRWISPWRALLFAAARELRFGLTAVAQEVRYWQRLAAGIPDPELRHDALSSLVDKRYYTDGAALFWILPARRSRELLALLVALQTIANYLDYASERVAAIGGRSSSKNLMMALVDAVDVHRPVHDYYAGSAAREDGGYLRALVERSRRACAVLPHYEIARPLLLREARRMESLDLCHDPVPARRDAALRQFAEREFPHVAGATWPELAGGATSLLGVIVLVALAADDTTAPADLDAAAAAYAPWVGALSTVLDSFIDQHEDAKTGDWSFVAYYEDDATAARRASELIVRCRAEIGALRQADRHMVILMMMLAMFLTSDSARREPLAASARKMLRAGGPMAVALAPVLRVWRLVYGLRE
jgi:tetraprenyl-beta-curcumene synthase